MFTHNITWVAFCKTTQTSGLYNCHLKNLIACLHGPGKQGKTKSPMAALC